MARNKKNWKKGNEKVSSRPNNEGQQNRHDPYKALKRYKANHLDKFSTNKAQTISYYTAKGKTSVRLVPATWGLVFSYAILNAFAVFGVRIIWLAYFGKPSADFITPSSEVIVIQQEQTFNPGPVR
jgi:hypothetical protein